MSKTVPLSSVDSAWLGMEDPTNLMMVTGVLTFDRPVSFARFQELLEVRWLKFDRFRMRVRESHVPLNPPYWEEDANFDIRSHLIRTALPKPGGKIALQELASNLLSTPLDFSKPLWQFHFIEEYEEGSAIIVRLHHCIADGMALMFLLLAMADFTDDAPLHKYSDDTAPKTKKRRKLLRGGIGVIAQRAVNTVNFTRSTARFIKKERDAIFADHGHLFDIAKTGADGAMAVSRLLLRPSDPQTVYRGKLGVRKQGIWIDPIPLADVKTIKNATGTTVNDVLVTALVGGLRHYMIERGESVEGVNFRAAIPVNLRKADEMEELGNKFGLVFLSLPIGIEDPLERLQEVHKRMAKLKNSSEATAALGLLSILGLTPKEMQASIVGQVAAKATAVMTNVPGPPIPLYMAGGKIKSLMFWVPQAGRVSLGLSIISYAGQVMMGIVTDSGLIADPDKILDGFNVDYTYLLDITRPQEEE